MCDIRCEPTGIEAGWVGMRKDTEWEIGEVRTEFGLTEKPSKRAAGTCNSSAETI